LRDLSSARGGGLIEALTEPVAGIAPNETAIEPVASNQAGLS
jgi:hypothetical protein